MTAITNLSELDIIQTGDYDSDSHEQPEDFLESGDYDSDSHEQPEDLLESVDDSYEDEDGPAFDPSPYTYYDAALRAGLIR